MLNWLTGKSKSKLPEPTTIQSQRSRQIEQLKSFNQNVSEIQRDVEYRVNAVTSGISLSFYISLPPQFPQEKPVVKVSPPVGHPWVDDQMIVVGSPGINNFIVHSDLGKVIHELVEEFQRNPPTQLPQQYFDMYPYGGSPSVGGPSVTVSSNVRPAPYTYASPSVSQAPSYPLPAATTTTTTNYSSHIPVSVAQVRTVPSTADYSNVSMNPGLANFGIPDLTHSILSQTQASSSSGNIGGYRMPELPPNFSQLLDLSLEELQELLDNEDKLLLVMQSLPSIEQITQDREQFMEQNEKLAQSNFFFKPVLEDKKKSLLEKYDTFNEVKQIYDGNAHQQDELRQKYDLRNIRDNLKVAAQKADEVSESIAENFLDGKITMDTFNRDYMEYRKNSHLRRAKEDRLNQLISSQSRGGF